MRIKEEAEMVQRKRGRDVEGRGSRSGLRENIHIGKGRDRWCVVAQLRANHLLSATQCGPVMDLITKSCPSIAKAAQIVSCDTVLREL